MISKTGETNSNELITSAALDDSFYGANEQEVMMVTHAE